MTASLTIDPGVARVALDRADKKSALDRPMRVALPRFFGQVQNDVSDHAAILAGADFSTGADSREMGGRGIPDELATSSTLATASLLLGRRTAQYMGQ